MPYHSLTINTAYHSLTIVTRIPRTMEVRFVSYPLSFFWHGLSLTLTLTLTLPNTNRLESLFAIQSRRQVDSGSSYFSP